MPVLKSTILRLEREIHEEHARSLAAMHQAYDHLASAMLTSARQLGYLGSDPMGALRQLLEPSPLNHQIAEETLTLWRTFFVCFRPDEAAFEAARFQEKAGQLDRRIGGLSPGQRPDEPMTVEILQTLNGLWEERHKDISTRLDSLIGELSSHQAQLGTVQLATAHQSDELERIGQVIRASLSEQQVRIIEGEPIAQQVARLIAQYRNELLESKRHAQRMIAAVRRLLDALNAIATRREPPPLPPEAEAVFVEVRKLDDARRELEVTVRDLRGQLAKVEGERRELMEEVASRDRRLNLYEDGNADKVDERLKLYRDAFSALESKGDPTPFLDKIRIIERVITLASAQEQQSVLVVDRHLAELAKCLESLHKVAPLAADPRRLRPRFFGSKYEFKTLKGQIVACRDASRDLIEYLDRARWALGVEMLGKHAPKLRSVFREMVSLVAHWRMQLGDPPPVSISISLDGGSGVLALPAILASDLHTIIGRKSRSGSPAASLVPVLEECVAMYHRTLEQAKGDAIPRSQPGKRESAGQAMTRLTAELSHLAALCETTFLEAANKEFTLSESDAALLHDDHLLRLALQNLDGICGELSSLANTPATPFTNLPARGKERDKLLTCGRQRCAWLEELAQYRIIVSG